jgi:hypothetical protein
MTTLVELKKWCHEAWEKAGLPAAELPPVSLDLNGARAGVFEALGPRAGLWVELRCRIRFSRPFMAVAIAAAAPEEPAVRLDLFGLPLFDRRARR